MSSRKLYLAFDLSTQSLKAVVSNEALEIVTQESISFDTDLREFGTENGVHRNSDGRTITSPTIMWVKAVDILMMKMMSNGVKFCDVCMISGTAQQHGSVYWAHSAEITLSSLNFNAMLTDQLQNCFMLNDSPVWMDSSTHKQCVEMEAAVGGNIALANITGSKAYERFTGNQIAKVYQKDKMLYNNCERISLVSSFLASLFLGRYAPIDYSDGSGMNLLNIQTKEWEPKLLEACAPGLGIRLGVPVPSSAVIGKVSSYMVNRYMFSPQCAIVAFTGDNPASLVGMRLNDADVAVSLGTSDTLIFWSEVAAPSIEGHVFVSPIEENEFMALLCFKNGSLSRELVCNRCCCASWEKFNNSLLRTPPGNNGNLGIYFDEVEILPYAKGVYRWNEADEFVSLFDDDDVEVRAVVEGQLLAKRYHAEKYGFVPALNSRILATGGASNNECILQVMCDIFNCPVYTLKETSNSACLGCIYRCKHAELGGGKATYYKTIKDITPHQLMCIPNPENVEVYGNLLRRYSKFESAVVEISPVKIEVSLHPVKQEIVLSPDMDESTISPDMGEATISPDNGETTISSDMDESTISPDMDESTISSDMGQSTTSLDMSGTTITPKMEESAISPDNGEVSTISPLKLDKITASPDNGEVSTAVPSDVSSTVPGDVSTTFPSDVNTLTHKEGGVAAISADKSKNITIWDVNEPMLVSDG